MRQFFKFFFASMLGFVGAIFLLFILLMAITAGLSSKLGDKTVEVKPNSVLELNIGYSISERTDENPFRQLMSGDIENAGNPGLNDIVKNIQKAAKDDNIKGIYIKADDFPNGLATLLAVRNALIEFKNSGKFIITYSESLGQKAFYLASVSDKIYLNPVGYMELKGLATELAFFKNALEKLEVEVQIFYAGKYKSATEPFRLEKMSEENREQINFILFDLFAKMKKDVAASRGITEEQLNEIIDNFGMRNARYALQTGLIDDLKFEDEVWDILKEKCGLKPEDKPNKISLKRYTKAKVSGFDKDAKSLLGDRIAVVYAEGNIIMGKSKPGEIGSETYAEAIKKAREDDKVKALVLRVNSGGGSALASDIILREMELAAQKMPVIVSMGDVAASGGYYIACKADTILAEPATITGSIGVFGMFPNMEGFFNNKLGFTFDVAKTSRFADMPSISRSLNEGEKMLFQSEIDTIYQLFKERVAEGRNMTVEMVDSFGRGRVWTGSQAKEIGLVDVLGGLDDAIKIAAWKAGIEDYRIKAFPEVKDPFERFLENLEGKATAWVLKKELGPLAPHVEFLKKLPQLQGPQMRMPFELNIR